MSTILGKIFALYFIFTAPIGFPVFYFVDCFLQPYDFAYAWTDYYTEVMILWGAESRI